MRHLILYAAVLFPVKILFTQSDAPLPADLAVQDPSAAAAVPTVGADAGAAAATTPATPAAAATGPDAGAAAGTPAAAAAAPPAPEAVSEQLTWPDTADLAEDAPTLFQNNDPKVIELFKKLGQSFDKVAEIIDPLVVARADLYQKYFELDAKLDEFFQNMGLDEGLLQGLAPVDTEPNATPTPTNLDTFKQDFDQIRAQLGVITTTKEDLKKKLSKLDSEIEKNKSALFQSRKKGLDILKQTTEADAQTIYNELNKELETILTTQKNLQTESTNDFQTAYDKIQADIQAVQTLVGKLRAKAIIPEETPVATPQQPTIPAADATTVAPIPSTPTPAAVPPQQPTKDVQPSTPPQAAQQAPFHHYLLARMTELFTGAMNVASTTYTTLKDTLNKSIVTKKEQAIEQKSKQDQTPPTTQTPPATPVAPATQTPPPAQTPPTTPAPQTPPTTQTPPPAQTPPAEQIPPVPPTPPTTQTPPPAQTPPTVPVTPAPQTPPADQTPPVPPTPPTAPQTPQAPVAPPVTQVAPTAQPTTATPPPQTPIAEQTQAANTATTPQPITP